MSELTYSVLLSEIKRMRLECLAKNEDEIICGAIVSLPVGQPIEQCPRCGSRWLHPIIVPAAGGQQADLPSRFMACLRDVLGHSSELLFRLHFEIPLPPR